MTCRLDGESHERSQASSFPCRRFEVTEMLTNEMTEHERRNAAGQRDSVTGIVTAPGYMGPRDAKGQ